MSQKVSPELTARYIWDNQEQGWLKYALYVNDAIPVVRLYLMRQVLVAVKDTLSAELESADISVLGEDGELNEYPYLYLHEDAWRPFKIFSGPWHANGRWVTTGIWTDEPDRKKRTQARIKDGFIQDTGKDWRPKGNYPEYVALEYWADWNTDEFLHASSSRPKELARPLASRLLELHEWLSESLGQNSYAKGR